MIERASLSKNGCVTPSDAGGRSMRSWNRLVLESDVIICLDLACPGSLGELQWAGGRHHNIAEVDLKQMWYSPMV